MPQNTKNFDAFYESDPLKQIRVSYPNDKIPGLVDGIIYQISCQSDHVFEFSKVDHQKMRCYCERDDFRYTCKKNRSFGTNLGKCVPGESYSEDGGDGQNGGSQGGGDFGGGFFDTIFDNTVLDEKRVKFSYFMRSLYDTFWAGPETYQTL